MQEKINPKLVMLLLLAAALSSTLGFVVIAGYILLKSTDDDLKSRTTELVWYFAVYTLAVVVLGLIPDVISALDRVSFINIDRSITNVLTGPLNFLIAVADIAFKCFVLSKAIPYVKK